MERMNDGRHNILFVGRISPNKKQEDVIRAFCCYRKEYDPESRLILIGSAGSMENYLEALKDYVRQLGLEESVVFPGHIRFAEILAYYRTADVFLCMSEHEGFCVPLVEAMYFGVPIAAYAAAAVPDTLGNGGLLLDSKEPAYAAAAMDRIIRDEGLRALIRKGQEAVLARFSRAETEKQMKECLERAMKM
jgi:glycosyltransferase involved in cell wall biosynthesis